MKLNVNNTVPAIIANASNIMALAIMRNLGRKGVPILAAFGKGHNAEPYHGIVRMSRFISKAYSFDEKNYEENFIHCLSDIGNNLEAKAVLFPVSDLDMILVSKHREILQKNYHIIMPSPALLTMLLHKDMFSDYALRENLPIPRTFIPRDLTDIAEVSRMVRYPCIIKPSWKTPEWIAHYGNEKAIRCDSPGELNEQFREASRLNNVLIVQEVVMGPETNIVCSFTYLDRYSKPLEIFISRKIRQYPLYFGNTSLAEAIIQPEVKALTDRICKQLELVGYVSIEFKRDERDGEYKILEITAARIDRQAGLSAECGMNIPYIWYNYTLGLDSNIELSDKPYRWASEVNEVRAAFFYLKNRDWTILEWLRSYRNTRSWEVFASDDLKPILMLMPSFLMHWASRLGRKVVKASSS